MWFLQESGRAPFSCLLDHLDGPSGVTSRGDVGPGPVSRHQSQSAAPWSVSTQGMSPGAQGVQRPSGQLPSGQLPIPHSPPSPRPAAAGAEVSTPVGALFKESLLTRSGNSWLCNQGNSCFVMTPTCAGGFLFTCQHWNSLENFYLKIIFTRNMIVCMLVIKNLMWKVEIPRHVSVRKLTHPHPGSVELSKRCEVWEGGFGPFSMRMF